MDGALDRGVAGDNTNDFRTMNRTLTALAFLVALPGCSGFPEPATEPLPPSPSLAISLGDPAYRQIASLSKLALLVGTCPSYKVH